VYTHDLKGRFLSINAAAERLFGYTRDELLAMQIRDLVDPAHLATAAANMALKAEGKVERTPPYELLTHAKDGHDVWVEVSTRAMHDGARVVGVQGIARDVTDRHARRKSKGPCASASSARSSAWPSSTSTRAISCAWPPTSWGHR